MKGDALAEMGDSPPHKGKAIAYEDGFPSPRRGEGRVRGASIEKRPKRAAALTFPLLRNGPLPLPIGERNNGEAPMCDALPTRGGNRSDSGFRGMRGLRVDAARRE